jgi:hypothetical protein
MSPVHEPSRDRSASLLCRVLRGVAYLLLVVAILSLLPDFYVLPQVVASPPLGAIGWYSFSWWLHPLAFGGTVVSLLIFRKCRKGVLWLPAAARIMTWGVGILFVGKLVFLIWLELTR